MEEKGYVSLHAGLFSSKYGLVGLDALTATDYVGGKVIIRGVKVLEVKGCVIMFWLIPLYSTACEWITTSSLLWMASTIT